MPRDLGFELLGLGLRDVFHDAVSVGTASVPQLLVKGTKMVPMLSPVRTGYRQPGHTLRTGHLTPFLSVRSRVFRVGAPVRSERCGARDEAKALRTAARKSGFVREK